MRLELTPEALKELHRRLKAKNVVPSVRVRLLTLLYFHEGKNASSIAATGLVTALTAARTLRLYQEGGFVALEDRERPGRTSAYTPEMRVRTLELLGQDDQVWNCTTLLYGVTFRRF